MQFDIKPKSKPADSDPQEKLIAEELQAEREKAGSEQPIGQPNTGTDPQTDSERAEELFRHNIVMEWTAPEFIYYEKGRNWFIFAAILFTALIVYSIIQLGVIPAIAFASMFILLYLYAQKKPDQIYFALTKFGIIYGSEMIPFRQIKRFWIEYDPPYLKELHLEVSGKLLTPKLSVQLLNMNPLKIRAALLAKVKEDDRLASGFTDALARLLRF